MSGMIERRRVLPAFAGLALILAAPVLSWHHVGDLSEHGHGELDHTMRPLRVSPGTAHVWVLGAQAVAVAAVLVLAFGLIRRWGRPGWALVVAPLAVVGLIAGLVARVMTAGVVGANIGAGLAVMLYGPLALLLVALAGWRSAVLLRGRRPA
jgi:hypothetical protein